MCWPYMALHVGVGPYVCAINGEMCAMYGHICELYRAICVSHNRYYVVCLYDNFQEPPGKQQCLIVPALSSLNF